MREAKRNAHYFTQAAGLETGSTRTQGHRRSISVGGALCLPDPARPLHTFPTAKAGRTSVGMWVCVCPRGLV